MAVVVRHFPLLNGISSTRTFPQTRQSTRAGATYGFALLGIVLLANVFKYPAVGIVFSLGFAIYYLYYLWVETT